MPVKQEEIWVDVNNFEGLYKVSNFGRVRNSKGLIMKQRYDKDNYRRVSLTKYSNGNKIHKTFFIHRLVAIHFINNPNNYPCVNHKDENKENNNTDNLEWCTKKYNNTYGSRKSIYKGRGASRKVIDVSNNIIYDSMSKAGIDNGVTAGSIYNCCTGRSNTANGNIFIFYDEYLTMQEAI